MLMKCISEASTSNNGEPLARLSYKNMLVQIIDINNNVVVYTFDRFIEIYDSEGLDGFIF